MEALVYSTTNMSADHTGSSVAAVVAVGDTDVTVAVGVDVCVRRGRRGRVCLVAVEVAGDDSGTMRLSRRRR